jgi:hypothetical protein
LIKLKKFTQVAYIPNHANGDVNHKDVQFGFTASEQLADGAYFVRYWLSRTSNELRTKANGERTYKSNLIMFTTHKDEEVLEAIRENNIC